ncbi:MAG: DUF4399 domain-containing protein [Gammaproteobacteria bacterium]|nr:DUF4399 domain-containing protein [Gammaproteobacteria bacterium]
MAGLISGCSGQETQTSDSGSVTVATTEQNRHTGADPDVLQDSNYSSPEPRAYIISPRNGASVNPTFKVIFGLSGMGVAPAGFDKEGTGHHHLLIDVAELPALDRPLPATDNIRHFGGGQTETTITLPPGKHTLQLLLGDYAHVPHTSPILSEVVTVTVVE